MGVPTCEDSRFGSNGWKVSHMFATGDTVVYRHHVCTVAGVREAYFEGRDYFELHTLFEKSLKLFVAVDDAKPPALRHVMSREDALALIDSIPSIQPIDEEILHAAGTTLSLAERQIKEEYERRLKKCEPEDLVAVIKSAYVRTQERETTGKRTTAVDKKYFELAESLLCDELAVALDMEREVTRDFLVERVSARVEQ